MHEPMQEPMNTQPGPRLPELKLKPAKPRDLYAVQSSGQLCRSRQTCLARLPSRSGLYILRTLADPRLHMQAQNAAVGISDLRAASRGLRVRQPQGTRSVGYLGCCAALVTVSKGSVAIKCAGVVAVILLGMFAPCFACVPCLMQDCHEVSGHT